MRLTRRGALRAPLTERTSSRRPMASTIESSPGRSATTVVATLPSNAVAFQSKLATSIRWWMRS